MREDSGVHEENDVVEFLFHDKGSNYILIIHTRLSCDGQKVFDNFQSDIAQLSIHDY